VVSVCMCARGRGGPIRAFQAYFLCQQVKRLLILFIINARREVYIFSSLAPFTNVNLRLPRFPPLTINTAVMADVAERMAIPMESMEQMAQVLKQL
jgi:hypothetical protein